MLRETTNENAASWNRKDRDAAETVGLIQSILDTCGIKTRISSETNYNDIWFSTRVEIDGFLQVGTNGKGVTREFSLASAYGEFMERLQSGLLLGSFYKNKTAKRENTEKIKGYLKEHQILETYFDRAVKNAESTEELETIISALTDLKLYYNLMNEEQVWLPDYLISFLSGSNGLAAGNTYEEAFAQGMAEIFERYALQYIYQEEYPEDYFSCVDEALYINTKSYHMIKAINEKGYRVYVVDCTLQGRVPVLGILITDRTDSKYAFRMGADMDLDICIQRCITEIFQGLNFDMSFHYHMNEMLASSPEGDFWNPGDMDHEYIKACIDGNGCLPRRFLNGRNYIVEKLPVFAENPPHDNFYAAGKMLELAKALSDKILITDFGKLGFPALRIFIPGVSENLYISTDNICRVFNAFMRLSEYVKQGDINHEEAFGCIMDILNYPAYTYGFSARKLFGIITRDSENVEYLSDPYLLIALLALHLGKNDIAYSYIQKSNSFEGKMKRTSQLNNMLIEAIIKEVPEEQYTKYIRQFHVEDEYLNKIKLYYQIKREGLRIYCKDCDDCGLKENCQYDQYKGIQEKMAECATQQPEAGKKFELFRMRLLAGEGGERKGD